MAHFDKGYYLKKDSFEVYYCTGEVHPKDSRAKVGISVRSEQLLLYEPDMPNFTRIPQNCLENICEAPVLVKKVAQQTMARQALRLQGELGEKELATHR
jgi:hypothetical protein